jgi:Type IX secretion system protein PorV
MRLFIFLIASSIFTGLSAQTIKKGADEIPVTSAVPFMRIPLDARAAGMGDIGVATSPDNNSDYHNPSKYAFMTHRAGFAINYSPWLRQLVDDIHLIGANAYFTPGKIGKEDELGMFNVGLRYFSLGKIEFTGPQGQYLGPYNPNELAINFGYSRKMSKKFGIGVSFKYIYSNLVGGFGGNNSKAGNAGAMDLSTFYTTPIKLKGDMKSRINWGLNLSNIGTKMNYSSTSSGDYLPANLATGVSYIMDIDEFNQVAFNFEVNKLMVPTPDTPKAANDPTIYDFKERSVPASILSSFGDAPNGFSEEIKEYIFQLGVEYTYSKLLSIRAGYFNENDAKGGRNFLTAGIGLKYTNFIINFSYLIPTSSSRNPLDNTMRFSMLFNFQEKEGAEGSKAPKKPYVSKSKLKPLPGATPPGSEASPTPRENKDKVDVPEVDPK